MDLLDKDSEDFIKYVINNYLLRGAQLGIIDKKKRDATYKRFKRNLQRMYNTEWRRVWRLCHSDMKEIVRPYKRFKKLIDKMKGEIDIKQIHDAFRPRQRGGKPRLDNLFITILILKGFFAWRFGRPRWGMIAEALSPHYDYTYSELESLWQHMKRIYLKRYGIKINEVEYAKMIYERYINSLD